MKKWVMLIMIVFLVSCDKEDDLLTDDNTYEVTLEPGVLKAGEVTELPIRIKSKEIGFLVTVYACNFYGGVWSIGHDVLPSFMLGNRVMHGVYSTFYLSKNDTTIVLNITPMAIFDNSETIAFDVYIKGNNAKDSNYDEQLGVLYASSYFTTEFDAPIIELFTPVAQDVSNSSFLFTAETLSIWSGVNKRLTYGLCYSINSIPTLEDNVYSITTIDYIYDNKRLTSFNNSSPLLISGLQPNTNYHFRLFADNGKISYSEVFEVHTLSIVDLEYEYLEIGKNYIADNHMTVTMNSIEKIVKEGYTEYRINYTLLNNTSNLEIPEKNFTIFSLSGDEKIYQTGFFDNLMPTQTITRSFTFNVLNSTNYHLLEYNTDFFTTTPTKGKLHWNLAGN